MVVKREGTETEESVFCSPVVLILEYFSRSFNGTERS